MASTGELREHDTLVQARDAVKNLYQQLDIEGRVRRNPLGMVAAALGLGFVLGGGLTTSLARRLLGIGVNRGIRLVLLPMLTEHLWGLAGSKRTGASTEGGQEVLLGAAIMTAGGNSRLVSRAVAEKLREMSCGIASWIRCRFSD